MVTPDHGYHGNTNAAVAISAYKFNKPGGIGKADWVELVEVADDYRGSFKRDDADRAQKFADLVDPAIAALLDRGQGVAGFIAETFPSVGGQIIPPKGYLPAVYEKIRAAGGVCIADEVTARSGTHDGVDIRELKPDLKFRIAALHTDRESISLICTDFIKHLKRSLRAYLKPSS